MTKFINQNQRKRYQEQGYLVLQGIYSPAEIKEMKDVLTQTWVATISKKEIFKRQENPLDSLFAPMQELHKTDGRMANVLLHPHNFDLAKEVIGEDVLAVGSTCFFKCPGAGPLVFHQDNYDFGADSGLVSAVWVSLDKADRDNGGLCIIPRSHLLGLYSPTGSVNKTLEELVCCPLPTSRTDEIRLPDDYEMINIQTEPGDVILFDGNTIHGSTGNSTQHQFRRSIVTHFVGKSVKRIYWNFNHLINRDREIEQRPINKYHTRLRSFHYQQTYLSK